MAAHAPRPVARGARARLLNGIYVILNESPRLLELARAVLDADVRLIQYRAKENVSAERLRTLRAMTNAKGALLILNDDWRAAIEFECDGVHLGPGDDGFDRVEFVRDALGERLIGLSCGTLEEVRAANEAGVDYLGIGAVFVTRSKNDAGAPIGVEKLGVLARASVAPVAAIGGLTVASIPEIRASGAAMAAVISTVSDAADPQRATRELVDAWQR